MYPPRPMGINLEPEITGPWICPIIRCRRELGIDLVWDEYGCRLPGGRLQGPIWAEVINDLPYIDREAFEDIRIALASTHRKGRPTVKGYKVGKYEQEGRVYDRCALMAGAKPSQKKRCPNRRKATWTEVSMLWTEPWNPSTTPTWSFNSFGQSSSQ